MLPETIRVFRQAADVVLGEARAGDQYGTLYAGAWTLMADEPPSNDEAREILTAEDLAVYQQEGVPEGRKAWCCGPLGVAILSTCCSSMSIAVGQLVDICRSRGGEVSAELAETHYE